MNVTHESEIGTISQTLPIWRLFERDRTHNRRSTTIHPYLLTRKSEWTMNNTDAHKHRIYESSFKEPSHSFLKNGLSLIITLICSLSKPFGGFLIRLRNTVTIPVALPRRYWASARFYSASALRRFWDWTCELVEPAILPNPALSQLLLVGAEPVSLFFFNMLNNPIVSLPLVRLTYFIH